ncbi:MAG: EAL domain-containing protein [Burkholderiales bacterium]|nr:EAL domain-containing protein [Burkholderiales bacterium]
MQKLIRTAFQPIMSARGQIVAYEALLRFRDGENKPEAREASIRRWEGTGYIGTVDVAVLKQAVAALGQLHPSIAVSVNVSSITVTQHAARYLRELTDLGALAKRLIIEITDSVVPQDPRSLLDFAKECAGRRVRVALDDCAPGMPRCEETVLRRLRPKLVKLDRKAISTAFQALDEEPLRALIQLAASLGCRAVAQGIDSQEKFDWAYALGVRYFQGFLVGHPRQFPLLDEQVAFRNLDLTQPPQDLDSVPAIAA